MEKPILLRGARQLLTLRGPSGPRRGAAMRELGIIQDGALLISGGIIQEVGPSRRVENLAAARDAIEIAADGRVVMPGFIDSETRLVGGEPRLEEDDGGGLEFDQEPIQGERKPAEPAWRRTLRELQSASKRRLEMRAKRTIRELIRHGTTSLEAKSPWGVDARTDLKILRVVEALRNKPLDVFPTYLLGQAPPEAAGSVDEHLEWLCEEMLPRLRTRRLARYVQVRCGLDAYPADRARRILSAARAQGFIPRISAGEGGADQAVAAAVEVDAASIDGLECVTPAEIDLLARAHTVATLLPGRALYQRRPDPPARTLVDGGVAVALASGFAPEECSSFSMPAMVALACAELSLTPAEAITAATINAAHALRCANRLGSLEYGKEADLLMLNTGDYRELPGRLGVNLVAMVMKRGEIVFPRMEF
jgi:imidazolonepropionase